MMIVSHRGYWQRPEEKNTALAFERSFDSGFGLETDVRDRDGQLVISHDPPGAQALHLDAFLKIYSACGQEEGLPLALNIKSDGLAGRLKLALDEAKVENYFVFDMSVPDMFAYRRQGMPFFTRMSEYEPIPALLSESSGIWLDAFDDEWYEMQLVRQLLASGRQVCIVSPELHGRDRDSFWKRLRELGQEPRLSICTDFPLEARDYFSS